MTDTVAITPQAMGYGSPGIVLAGHGGDKGRDYGYGPLHNDHVAMMGKFEDLAGRVGSVKDTLMTGFSAQDAQRQTQTASLVAGQSQLQQSINNTECRLAMEVTAARADVKNRIDDAHCDINKSIADVHCDLKTNELETRHFLSRELSQGFGAIGAAISASDKMNMSEHASTRELINTLERDRLRDRNNELLHAGLVDRHISGLRLEINQIQNNNQLQVQNIGHQVGRLCDRYEADVYQRFSQSGRVVNIGSGSAENTNKGNQNSL